MTVAPATIRYWAAAKAAAGCDTEPVEATTVGEAVAAARAAHGPDLARVLDRCSFLLDGRRARPDTPLVAGSVLEVLPPFAGG